MKVRHICAIAGIAVAVGSVVFMQSLVASNDAQAPETARRLSAPWGAWKVEGLRMRGRRGVPPAEGRDASAKNAPGGKALPSPDLTLSAVSMQIDYRPDGHVLQGPPMTCVVSRAPGSGASPYAAAPLAEGRWVDDSSDEPEVVCARGTLRRFGRGKTAALGETVKFIGEKGAVPFKIVGYLDAEKLPAGWPNVFANAAAFAALEGETVGTVSFWRDAVSGPGVQNVETIAPQFMSDAGRNFDRSKMLLLWAAALTAVCLLVNSLFLSVEAKRRDIAILRMVGMTRLGVVRLVFGESVALTAAGFSVGVVVSLLALFAYVCADSAMFPTGPAVSFGSIAACAVVAPAVAVAACLAALKPALSVRPLEAASARMPRRRMAGMLVAFAFGFGAFVAVEVWGSSLMSAFVPSPEWPDAIVSILPGGVSSFDIERLRSVEGVRRIAELQPLQVNFDPLEEMKGPSRGPSAGYRNALLLASDWMPRFRFAEGDYDSATNMVFSGDACLVTSMMARSRGLGKGDTVRLDCGRGFKMELKVAGIVDLNWHMVTSRGLVRGLNRMPVQTDGPLFVSFDTLAACDARPQDLVSMTHLWLDYEPSFLGRHGVFEAGSLVEKGIVEALGGAYLETAEGEVRGNAVRLHARDEISDGTLAHGNDLIGSMARVPFIFIGVISLGFVAMIVAGVDSRRRELMVLRAVGATRTQLALMLVREALATAAGGIALGLAGGALAGWLFTFGTRSVMSNWGIPPNFAVPWCEIAKGALGAILFALAVALPASMFIIRRETAR